MTDQIHPIRLYRHAQNPRMSLSDLAGKIGVTKGFLSRVETGNEKLSIAVGERLSDVTGIPMRELFPDLAKKFAVVAEAAE